MADLLDARSATVVARLQHLRGLSLLDNHHSQPVPDQALHAVKVFGLWESAVGLVTLCSRRRLIQMSNEGTPMAKIALACKPGSMQQSSSGVSEVA